MCSVWRIPWMAVGAVLLLMPVQARAEAPDSGTADRVIKHGKTLTASAVSCRSVRMDCCIDRLARVLAAADRGCSPPAAGEDVQG